MWDAGAEGSCIKAHKFKISGSNHINKQRSRPLTVVALHDDTIGLATCMGYQVCVFWLGGII